MRSDLEQASRSLHSVAIHLLRNLRVQDSALGIGPSQLSALSVIVFRGSASLHELAKTEQIRAPTMSRIVDALVEAGMVKREVNKKDRRSITISPTAKGVRVMREGRRRREMRLTEILTPLSREEIRLIGKASELLSKALQATSQ